MYQMGMDDVQIIDPFSFKSCAKCEVVSFALSSHFIIDHPRHIYPPPALTMVADLLHDHVGLRGERLLC